MKRWLWILSGLVVVGGIALVGTSRGQYLLGNKPQPFAVPPLPMPGQTPTTKVAPQSDLGPGAQGATLRMPSMDTPEPVKPQPAPQPQNTTPAYVQQMLPTTNNNVAGLEPRPIKRVALPPMNRHDINKDIEIHENCGEFAIFVMGYTTENAPEMARQFVAEIYTNPQYAQHKLKAYIFNYGAEEKMAEYKRVQALRKQQEDMLKEKNLTNVMPVRIRTVRIDEQTAVLLGGFRTREDAERALVHVKKLPQPDANKVKMDMTYLGELPEDRRGQPVVSGAIQSYHGYHYVNPFTRAFVTRNPKIKEQGNDQLPAEDLEFLQRVNKSEPFSLFHCKGKLTLVVKQFNTQYKMVDKDQAKRFLASLSKLAPLKSGDWQDSAAHNAHNLAEAFRKSGLPETYVLHNKNCSFVTVGGFDSVDDQRLVQMQEFLAQRFRDPAYRPFEMLPRPIPMMVPR